MFAVGWSHRSDTARKILSRWCEYRMDIAPLVNKKLAWPGSLNYLALDITT
jgi:hypothetical protein